MIVPTTQLGAAPLRVRPVLLGPCVLAHPKRSLIQTPNRSSSLDVTRWEKVSPSSSLLGGAPSFDVDDGKLKDIAIPDCPILLEA